MKSLIFLLIIFCSIGVYSQPQFMVEPIYQDLGQLVPGGYTEFQVTVKNQFYTSFQTYEVSIVGNHNWATPDVQYFSLETPFDEKVITFSGTVPQDIPLGNHGFFIDITNINNANIFNIITVDYLISTLGAGDHIKIEQGEESFSELDNISYYTVFYDSHEPFGDQIVNWEFTMNLMTVDGEYEYKTITKTCCCNNTTFSFTADLLPTNQTFIRDEDGNIKGNVFIEAYDQDYYGHFTEMDIVVNKVPDKPFVYTQIIENSDVKIMAYGSGMSNYQLHYDTDSGYPYQGTGLLQGNSPINLSSANQILLSGFDPCQTYYFALTGQNSNGTSEFSDEISIMPFTPPDSEPIMVNLFDLSVPYDYVLTGNYYFGGNLIVEAGASLTIENGTMYFNNNSKIIIQPGATLTLNGTTLTAECGQMWQGIEVWGDKTQHQYTVYGECAQGKLIANNALIENAVSAIELWKPDDYSKTGGIVYAENTIFRNNGKSAHALLYKNFHPITPEVEMDYSSKFKRCTFEINENYRAQVLFSKHIDFLGIKGVNFWACDFIVNNSITGVSATNSAIALYDAGVGILPSCSTPTIPCATYDKNTFSGFYKAVSANNSEDGTYPVYIKMADFNNNAYGVMLRNAHAATIISSEFNIGYNEAEKQLCGQKNTGYGIYTDNSSMFVIEDNIFRKATGAETGNYTGIRIENTYAAFDEVYKNTFEGLSYGNYAEGKNWSERNTFEGLAYYCNINTDNYADFYVEQDINRIGGIQTYQGSTTEVAGNTFSPLADWHFYNNGNHAVIYYYCSTCPDENPELLFQVFDQPINLSNLCPPRHSGGSGSDPAEKHILDAGEKLVKEQEFANALTDLNNVTALYEQLEDGGNTDAVQQEIATAWPDQVMELRASLLGKSPHLSETVLKSMADRTDLLPDAVIFEILSANPDELRSESLIKYLKEKDTPLPTYMVEILKQLAGGISYKSVLQQEMAKYNRARARAAIDMIHSELNDTISSGSVLRNWLDNLGGQRADELLVASLIKENNFTAALALAGLMPSDYQYNAFELNEYEYYMDMLDLQINIKQTGRTIRDLNTAEINSLIELAENSSGTAGARARGILEYTYGYNFCNCTNTQDSEGYKSATIKTDDYTNALGLSISISPNPAKDWAVFRYNLPEGNASAKIIISDISGRHLETLSVEGKMGEIIWDLREYNSGVYLFTILTSDGLSQRAKITVL